MLHVVWWEVKVSKLCNLRCTYCYEFEELGDKRRVSLDGWRKILESARWYQERMERRHGRGNVATRFLWHGGEPLLLPLRYYEDVVALQKEIFGADKLRDHTYGNDVPTNLFAVPPALVDFFKREGFQIAVSFDLDSTARVDVAGRPTQRKVAQNMERLMADGWTLGCNTVLAAHTAPRLTEVYDFVRDLSHRSASHVYHNIIPLHRTPTDDGTAPFHLDAEPIVDALFRLFERWVDDPGAIALAPIQEYYLGVLRKVRGLPRLRAFDRRRDGEAVLIVNTDGRLFLFNDAYDPDKALGNVFEQPLREIMASPAYRASLRRDAERAARHCGTCPYDGYCSREPLVNSHRDHPGEHCAIGFPLYQKVERWARERGLDAMPLEDVPNARFVLARPEDPGGRSPVGPRREPAKAGQPVA